MFAGCAEAHGWNYLDEGVGNCYGWAWVSVYHKWSLKVPFEATDGCKPCVSNAARKYIVSLTWRLPPPYSSSKSHRSHYPSTFLATFQPRTSNYTNNSTHCVSFESSSSSECIWMCPRIWSEVGCLRESGYWDCPSHRKLFLLEELSADYGRGRVSSSFVRSETWNELCSLCCCETGLRFRDFSNGRKLYCWDESVDYGQVRESLDCVSERTRKIQSWFCCTRESGFGDGPNQRKLKNGRWKEDEKLITGRSSCLILIWTIYFAYHCKHRQWQTVIFIKSVRHSCQTDLIKEFEAVRVNLYNSSDFLFLIYSDSAIHLFSLLV